jgi:hypothetical protein
MAGIEMTSLYDKIYLNYYLNIFYFYPYIFYIFIPMQRTGILLGIYSFDVNSTTHPHLT